MGCHGRFGEPAVMKFATDIRGMADLMDRLADMPDRANAAAARTLNFIAQSTAQRAKHLVMSGQKSGRVYFLAGGRHQASAPGEPPANLSGRLAASIRYTKMTDREGSFATAGTTLAYGRTLEYGGFVQATGQFAGAGSVYIEPRPFLRPAFEAAMQQAEGKLKKEFEARR